MAKALKFAFLSGVAGAGYAVYSSRTTPTTDANGTGEQTREDLAVTAAKVGAGAAGAGLVVGFVLDRRGSKRRKRKALKALNKAKAKSGKKLGQAQKAVKASKKDLKKAAKKVGKAGGFAEAAKLAKPALDSAIEAMGHAAEAARPHVEHAAVVTKDAAIHYAEVARPKVEAAAKVARDKASDAATAAKPSVDRLADKGKEILVAAESKRPILVKVA
ncbi:MAG: hypothetical protein QOG03_2589 [Actinomycetota bacterium]|jgi:hypothetical protein|nr:hypothetical protein [Actinomycetota bacterium]